jgi:integrase
MLTGQRRGEISALRWRHVDLDRGVLWVHHSNARRKPA